MLYIIVPYEIRKFNPDAYTPKAVSIGPFHYGKGRLPKMEGQKLIYFRSLLDRSDARLEDFVSCVQELEPRVRCSYSENIRLSKEEFVKMILVDCAFIIELFLSDYTSVERRDNDAIWLRNIWLDLLLLENQLPFFVLEKLYNLAFASHSTPYPSFLDLTVHFLFEGKQSSPFTGSVTHFTNLYRTFKLPPSGHGPLRVYEVLTRLPSATQLNEAGIKFMVNGSSPLKLDLSGSILTLPEIIADESAEILLRNIVALEECHYPMESYITDYLVFLDFLINTDKDVDFLVTKGIIDNRLRNSNKMAEMFNGLLNNVTHATISANYLEIYSELNAYYRRP